MKNKGAILVLTSVLMLTISVSQSLPNPDTDNFYINPLLLNGKSMDVTKVSRVSRGKLSMIQPTAESAGSSQVPFFVYLKRSGKIVDAGSYAHNHAVTEIELSTVLQSAKAGDELVIDPARETEKQLRRVLTIKHDRQYPQIQWFRYGSNKGNDGC